MRNHSQTKKKIPPQIKNPIPANSINSVNEQNMMNEDELFYDFINIIDVL